MPSLRLPRTFTSILLASVLLLVASCLPGAGSGVNVRGFATELVFGVPEEEEPIDVTPPGFPTEPDRPSLGTIDDRRVERDPGPEPPPPLLCPAAPLDASADRAPSVIESQPVQGRYLWGLEGWQETEFGRVELDGFMRREVHEVEDISDGFEFTTQEQEISFGQSATVRQTFRVVQDSDILDDGIYLVRIHRESQTGEGVFAPQPPIMFLPLPAQIGGEPVGELELIVAEPEQMNTVGIDPRSFATLRHTGSITEKRYVDACGTLVDTWYVEAMQEYVSATGTSYQRSFNYAVATQHGGIIVFEEVRTPCATVDEETGACTPDPQLQYQAHLGQVEPDPLTEAP